MPYREKTLAGANANALAEEMRLELDSALAAHPAWSKVTSAYAASATWLFDVWQNNGTADGYGWFLVIGKNKTTAHCLMGGALEYDPVTWVAKKAIRGYGGVGFVDANGYPLVAAGGAEMTFPLASFNAASASTAGMLYYGALPAAVPATGNWVRTLVTDRMVWQGYGTPTTLSNCHGIGTYQQLHSTTQDLKPLGILMATAASFGGGTVWQHPSATDANVSRSSQAWTTSTSARWDGCAATAMSGEVGGLVDLLHGGVVGARAMVTRNSIAATKETPALTDTAGGFLGLVPDDFLIFDRANGCQIGDTITVGGKIYVSVDTPATSGGLFINTQPAV